MKRANVTYFLDGAHNIDSMEVQGWGGAGVGGAGECECVPWSDSLFDLSDLLPVV